MNCEHVPADNSRQSISPKLKKPGKTGQDPKSKKPFFLF